MKRVHYKKDCFQHKTCRKRKHLFDPLFARTRLLKLHKTSSLSGWGWARGPEVRGDGGSAGAGGDEIIAP